MSLISDPGGPSGSAREAARITVFGAAGRMGRQLLQATAERQLAHGDVALVAAVELPGSPAVGQDCSLLSAAVPTGVATVGAQLGAALGDTDVVVDFTRPEPSIAQLPAIVDSGKALVIGTTGFSTAQKAEILRASASIAIVHASNYSVGVTLALKLLGVAAQVLGDDYDVEIIEAHHRNKVDAPSGTALSMGEVIAAALGRDLAECAVYGREGHTGVREPHTMGFATVRGGDIIGEHTVLFAGEGERLEITHKATDRLTFARGAIRAAHWVASARPGLYDMADVIGLS